MQHPQLAEILAKLRAGMEQHYGDRLAHLVLFGSQARGDAEDGSDIDVLVVLRGEVDSIIEGRRHHSFIAALSLQYDTVLYCLFISESQYRAKKLSLLRNVWREGIQI